MNNNKQLPSTTGAWVLMVLCLLYGVSPVDIIPDIPVVGQIDDLIILASGGLNLVQRYMERADSSLTTVVKVVKWKSLPSASYSSSSSPCLRWR